VKRRWPPKEPRPPAPRPDGDQPYILRRPPASLSNVAERRVTTILDQIIATYAALADGGVAAAVIFWCSEQPERLPPPDELAGAGSARCRRPTSQSHARMPTPVL
jgi:hypothetical protein